MSLIRPPLGASRRQRLLGRRPKCLAPTTMHPASVAPCSGMRGTVRRPPGCPSRSAAAPDRRHRTSRPGSRSRLCRSRRAASTKIRSKRCRNCRNSERIVSARKRTPPVDSVTPAVRTIRFACAVSCNASSSDVTPANTSRRPGFSVRASAAAMPGLDRFASTMAIAAVPGGPR